MATALSDVVLLLMETDEEIKARAPRRARGRVAVRGDPPPKRDLRRSSLQDNTIPIRLFNDCY